MNFDRFTLNKKVFFSAEDSFVAVKNYLFITKSGYYQIQTFNNNVVITLFGASVFNNINKS